MQTLEREDVVILEVNVCVKVNRVDPALHLSLHEVFHLVQILVNDKVLVRLEEQFAHSFLVKEGVFNLSL